MGPKIVHYARQFGDFNEGGHFNLIQLVAHNNFKKAV